jgi:lactoylglutathione lyase
MNITKTYFMVPVQDMDRALAFYRDALGITLRFSSPGWTELAWRDATIALHLGGTAAEREGWLGFEVDDLDAAVAEIEAAGGRGANPPKEEFGSSPSPTAREAP